MKDPLKKHIDSQRESFELFDADFDGLWDKVADKLDEQETKTKRHVLWSKAWKVAAMLLFALGVGWLFIPRQQQMLANTPTTEWEETQQFYSAAIEEKMMVLEARKGKVDERIFDDLAFLDQAMKELKTDLRDQADNEEVVNAMVRNYQIKLKILEEILEQLQQNEEDNQQMEDPAT